MFFKYILATLCVTAAFNSGGTASIDFPVLLEAKDNYLAFIVDLVNNHVQIPNISFDKGHIDGNTFHITETASNVGIVAGTANSLKVTLNNLKASFHSNDLRYSVLFLTATGSLDASISSMGVSLELGVTTQTLADGKVVPSVKFISSSVNLPKDNISLSIHGNVIAEFAELFKSLFMGSVRDAIVSQINGALKG